ncbi:GreA/GreB family elongation factor [Reichenbachiella sp.]|uniref:GreA/GreB family elongation factor n=1 Tax=Reichenbachiella sp. TaxID=2184521 RepID=UPI003BB18837
MIKKQKIHAACLDVLEKKINIARKGMEEAQASANNETKSSAGDKYETSRAMSQRERDLHARQLAELVNMKKTLATIDPDKTCSKVVLGALVETENSSFYISASLGALEIESGQIMVISAISPIAQAMLDKKVGDTFEWMKKETKILQIN